MVKKIVLSILGLFLLGGLLAACGGGDGEPEAISLEEVDEKRQGTNPRGYGNKDDETVVTEKEEVDEESDDSKSPVSPVETSTTLKPGEVRYGEPGEIITDDPDAPVPDEPIDYGNVPPVNDTRPSPTTLPPAIPGDGTHLGTKPANYKTPEPGSTAAKALAEGWHPVYGVDFWECVDAAAARHFSTPPDPSITITYDEALDKCEKDHVHWRDWGLDPPNG